MDEEKNVVLRGVSPYAIMKVTGHWRLRQLREICHATGVRSYDTVEGVGVLQVICNLIIIYLIPTVMIVKIITEDSPEELEVAVNDHIVMNQTVISVSYAIGSYPTKADFSAMILSKR